MGNFK